MTIASDITAANSAIETALESIEAQMTILETDRASDPTTFNKSGGPQAAGVLSYRMGLLKPRWDKLICDNR